MRDVADTILIDIGRIMLPGEHIFPSDHVKEDSTDTEDIRLSIVALPIQSFWRDIARRPIDLRDFIEIVLGIVGRRLMRLVLWLYTLQFSELASETEICYSHILWLDKCSILGGMKD